MGSIKQYTDIFRQNREAIDRNSAEVLNSRRQAALKALDDRELPDRRDEGFEKTSIDEMFAPTSGSTSTASTSPSMWHRRSAAMSQT